jgi:hypothetical protein
MLDNHGFSTHKMGFFITYIYNTLNTNPQNILIMKKLLTITTGLCGMAVAMTAQTTVTANLDQTMRVQKGGESGTVYEALFQGGTNAGFQGLKTLRDMVEKADGFPPVANPEDAPIGWTGSNVVHGLSVVFTPDASAVAAINAASQLNFEFSVANVQGTAADGSIEIYMTRVGPLVGGNTGPLGGNWGGYKNYNGTGEGYEANGSTLVASIVPSIVQSYSLDVTNIFNTVYGGSMNAGEEVSFLIIMQDDVVTAGTLGDAITNSTPGVTNRTNIELGTALDQSMGPSLVAVPEPSTYAAILGAAALGLIAFRRRRQK